MASGSNIKTYFRGEWHDGDVPVMRAADHGAWLGTTVFDGARFAHGVTPDLRKHCERLNRSAEALMLTPAVGVDEMLEIVRAGLALYPADAAVYIRPMYWGLDGGHLMILNDGAAGFCICLEEFPMAPDGTRAKLSTTRFRRPVLDSNVVNAKAGCLYPNNARMLAEARAKGCDNALCLDALGNVAEAATANVFMVKDGAVFTPIPNGTFLSGITRARHIANLRADGIEVHETVLTLDDFRGADEIFLSGNMMKVTPVSEFDGASYGDAPVTKRVAELYWDWALSER